DRGAPFAAVFRLGHEVIIRGKESAHNAPIVLLILDHKDALGHAGLALSFTTIGSVKENVEPCPTADCSDISPPCISIMRLDIASPRPVPPFFLVIELSAC